MNTILKRVLSLVLCFVLVAGYLPTGALAAETGETVDTEATEVTAEATETSEEAEATSEPTEAPTEAPTEPSNEATEPSTEATEPAVIAVTGITLDKTTVEVGVGELPMTLTATVQPEDATDKTVTWTSSEPGVVSVEDGVLTFGYMGTATITATAGAFSASCTVKVGEGEASWYEYTGPDYLDAAIFCSDVHGSTSDLTSTMSGVATSGVTYSSIGFVGDTCLTVAKTESAVNSGLGYTPTVMFSYASSHDTENSADISTNWNYSGEVEDVSDYYLVYTIREDDMKSDTGADDAFTSWYDGLTDAEKKLPIFIMSHRPLHARRNDNAGAAGWYSAISAAAESSDITFFWAHNHTSESSVDTAAYYVAKDGTETFTVYNGSTVVPNFTYMNAGYINANGQNPARKGIATTVRITTDSLIFQDYNSSGEYTGTYAHNVTVAREFAASEPEVTLTSIAISGTNAYTVGDELALTVTATYSDGTTKDVTAEATLNGYDMTAAGTYTVKAEYEGMTAEYAITVSAATAEPTVNTVECWDDTEQVIVKATGLGLTEVVATNVTGDNEKCDEVFTENGYMAFDIALTGLAEGDVAYSVSVVPDLDTTNLELYYIDENGALTPVEFKLTTDELNNVYVEFTTDHDGTFVYGSPKVPEGYTLTSLTLTNIPVDVFQGGSLVLDETAEITATYTMAGAEDFTRKLTIYDYDASNFSGFDVNVAGKQTVTFTFEGVTATHEIYVWGDSVEQSGVTVALDKDGAEYGVTAVNVSESGNTNVAEAVANVMAEGYVAYDISLVYAENYVATEDTKTVTLPIPEGVSNPVVYYVSDDGETVENMNAVKDGNGNVTFTTTHFSTYVIGESTEITVPENSTATGSGTITTTEKKTIYKLVSSLTAGEEYLIVSRNTAGSGYGLAGSTTGQTVTVEAADDVSSVVYIEDKGNALEWTAASGWNFSSGSYDLGVTQSGGSRSLSFSTSSNWTLGTNQLYYKGTKNSYYLACSSGTWRVSSSSTSSRYAYFYQKTEVDVETTTTVSGTYSIAGEDLTKVVVEGSTAELSSTLTFTPSDGGTATTTENPTGVTYTLVEGGDPNGVISSISGSTVTFTGVYGTALVKVSYTTQFGDVTNYITVTATEPTYVLDVTKGEDVITGTTVAVKGVTASTTLQLGTQIQFVDGDGAKIVELPDGATVEWHIPEEYQAVATVDHETGLVSFKGVNGAFYVTATLTVNGKDYTAGVNISATTTSYSVPSDGVSDFPEYPNEGAIRFDKTATAVGNFSETGLAQVEISMTGVPYTTGSEIDVVLMLDMTGSMDDVSSSSSEPTGYVRIDATIAASKAFINTIVKNEDGSYNGNRIGVYVFNKNGAATLYNFGSVDSDTELNAIYADLNTIKDDHFASGGTPYDDGLAKCQSVLAAAKTDGVGNDRQQFCVFMTDGVPTSYAYVNGTSYGTHSSASAVAGMLTSSSDYATRDTDYKYEYYSTEMKKAGVTVYSVGVGLENKNNAWSGSATQCLNLASALLNDISGPANEAQQPDSIGSSTHSKQDHYFFSVEDATAATDMEKVFSNIAMKILQAATNVTVEDQIGDNYTMVFDIPEGSKDITGVTNDFYIEFGKYALDEDHERTTFTSVTKVYLENNGDVLSAKDAADPVFEQKTIGEKGTLYYWSTNEDDGDSGISVTVDGTTYYFVSYGMEEAGYNMTSGTYAYGTVDSTTNMSNDLVIATPYFVYNAATKMLYWTVDKLDTEEYALRYFVYLNNSATEVGTDKEADPGSYLTNDHAYITYTNFNGNDCRQEFPKPQLTWNGAQVSYVFYLVNAQGQPINKSGQVVDFANATFITDVYTKSVVWNKEGDTTTGTGELSADWLADDLLPGDYEIYDEQAHYALNVYENADGSTIKNQFTISGGEAADISVSLNTRLALATTASTVSTATTKVYNTKAGEKISAYGTYTSADSSMKDFDFANTTVAFAVVWQPRLVPDTVVVDYGLDVLINVTQNDILQNSVSGIGVGKDAYGSTAMNTGFSTASKLGTAALTIDGNTISIENENAIRFHQGDMQFAEPVLFYYETPVEFWEGSDPTEGYMYSSVTVIPATTVYYEDDFLTLDSFTKSGDTWTQDEISKWTASVQNGVQDQDRPGESQISAALDADNNYGYDSAYETMSTHSLNNSAHITVDADIRGEATFTFYGTGFDVISMTSSTTGTLTVQVYSGAEASGTAVKTSVVDTYYGMDADGNISLNNPDAIYQVPVMKIFGLTYGQYTVKITAAYNQFFDHDNGGSYDLYLDAIRIYDPTGNLDETANDAYVADGEAWPTYVELRNNVISASGYTVTENEDGTVTVTGELAQGVVFIDCNDKAELADYVSYGPNNELYLANNQAVAFKVTDADIADIQLGIKVANGGSVTYEINGDSYTVETTTDMYYSILDYAKDGQTVVIENVSGGILSLTNIKVTHTTAPDDPSGISLLSMDADSVGYALMSLRAPVVEDVPETTVPEETEPEETVPETSEPEATDPETEPTEPEATEPEEDASEEVTVEKVVETVKKIVKKLFGWLFG